MSSTWDHVGDFVDRHAEVLIQRPLRILLIIVVALVLRFLLHRLIERLTKLPADGAPPGMLRALNGHVAGSAIIGAAAGLAGERRRQRALTLRSVLKSAVSFIVFIFATLYIISELQFSLAPLLAGTSIAGVAIGFGAQNIIKDFLGGMFMIFEDQYGVGDVVDLQLATGTIEAVGLRSTRLRDEAGTVWYVRNGEVLRVGNQSQGFAQVVLDIPVPSGSASVARAERVMRDVAVRMVAEPDWSDKFLRDPVVQGVQSIALDVSTVRMVARVRPLQQWAVAREMRGRILAGLHGPDDPAQDDEGPGSGSEPPPQPTAGGSA